MKPRHAAALAVVGWYLMVPPTGIKSPTGDLSAPLSQWTRSGYHLYDLQEQCERDLDDERERLRSLGAMPAQRLMASAQCVSEDDPRLKAK